MARPAHAIHLVLGACFALVPPLAFLAVDGEPGDLLSPLCAVLLVEAVWAIWSWRSESHSLFDPYLLFLGAVLLFNGGQALLEVVSLNPQGLLNGDYPPSLMAPTLGLVISAVGALHTGALVALRPRTQGVRAATAGERPALFTAGLALYCIAIVPVCIRIGTATREVLSGGYMALYRNLAPAGVDSAIYILEALIVPATLLLVASQRSRFFAGWLPFGTLVLYALSQLFLGYRANATFPLIAALWVRARTVKPVRPAPVLAVTALLVVVVFPLVRTTRTVAGEERASLSFLTDALSGVQRPLVAVLTEMGGSMRTVTETMRLVPRSHGFELGEGFAYDLLSVVPSLFWDRHPTIARGTPAVWLTTEVDPVQARLGGSLGYSVVAEAYLNFGWLGALLFFALGFGIVRVWLWAEQRSATALASLGAFLPALIFFARSDSSSLARMALWYVTGPYLLTAWLSSRSQRRALAT